jgi:fructooligosaccharide transport system permease protein
MKKKDLIKRPSYLFFGKRYNKWDSLYGILFCLPAILLGLLFVLLPMIISLSYSFTDANLLKLNNINFVGLKNFINVFKDPLVGKAFLNTLHFVILVIPLQFVLSFGLALILNSKIRFNKFFRWAFFIPVLLSLAITSMLWINLLNEDAGLIGSFFASLGFDKVKFLSDPKKAMNIIVLISAWQGAGYQMLIFLAALKNVSKEMYEAAQIDGSNSWQRFIYLTMPAIKPTISFVLVTMLIGAFRLITQPMIMTSGGPLDSTLTVSYYIYQQGITYREVGYSSAIALLYTVFMSVIALGIRALLDGKKEKSL